MKINIFILLLFSIGFIGCTKIGRNITVQGKVLNPLTDKPYKDIEIKLLKKVKTPIIMEVIR